MSFATRHNKSNNWNVNTDGFEFVSLEELFDKNPHETYVVCGLYINKKGNYGDAPVAILPDCFVNLPAFMCDEVYDILASEEDVEVIQNRKVGFKVRSYVKELAGKGGRVTKKTCYAIDWLDI